MYVSVYVYYVYIVWGIVAIIVCICLCICMYVQYKHNILVCVCSMVLVCFSYNYNFVFYIHCIYTFEGNHCLINGVLGVWSVGLPKPGLDGIEDRENLLESMVPGLIPQRQASVVHKMKIPRDLLEAVTEYPGGYEAVSQLLIRRPIVSNLWEMVYTHNDVKANVGFEPPPPPPYAHPYRRKKSERCDGQVE